MNTNDFAWCILKLKTILYDAVTGELVLWWVANFIDNYRKIAHVI